ncbi:MAG: helix-turn-helix domain-containing protein [Planctomycetes bacterium]|nr:helix-turn-helix domain-containing protein [Planctomycetota bacterium]
MPASDLPDPQREILNLDEAAAYLGVSTKTFQKVLREGEMPGRKVGREWKFSRKALEAWIGAGRSKDFLDREDEEAAAADGARALVAAAGANGGRGAAAPARAAGAAGRSRHAAGAFEAEED